MTFRIKNILTVPQSSGPEDICHFNDRTFYLDFPKEPH